MKNNKTLTVIKIIALCCLCIAVFGWITDARKLAGYEKIREASKKEISNISDMEAEEYIKTIEVEFDYRTKDNYLDSKCKLFCNYMTFIVTFDESFDELTVRDKATQIVKYDHMLHNNYKSYLDRAGYYDFMKRYGIGDNYFEVHGANYYIDNDYNVKYYCESKQYSLYPYTLYINNLNKYSLEQYDIRYKDGNLIKIEKHEYSNEDNTATESKKSVPKKTPAKKSSSNTTTEKSHDPDDYDIDTYYEDYKDEFEDEDEAWDDFEDNEGWEDY